MAAQRIKVDLSDDPMASLFEDDFVPAAKPRVAAPVVGAGGEEEPALVSLNVGNLTLNNPQRASAFARQGR